MLGKASVWKTGNRSNCQGERASNLEKYLPDNRTNDKNDSEFDQLMMLNEYLYVRYFNMYLLFVVQLFKADNLFVSRNVN